MLVLHNDEGRLITSEYGILVLHNDEGRLITSEYSMLVLYTMMKGA